jgi:uncharacterized protein YecE (DUF72 family)
MKGTARIGTSGFSYDHWRGVFYPDGVAQRQWLEHYAKHFDTVELNSTFYSMPRSTTCRTWRARTPKGFCFAVKLNRWITHRKRLIDCGEPLGAYLEAVGELKGKLGPVLIQLPPGLAADTRRLDEFLDICPKRRRWAVEFRNAAWLCPDVYAVLRRHNAALCIHDLLQDHPMETTADWVYLRYHGAGTRYGGCYSRQRLSAEAERIRHWLQRGYDVFAYFNNDAHGYAVQNAAELKRLCRAS